MQLVAEYKGEKYEIGTPQLIDFVLLERKFGVSASRVQDDPRMEYMCFLAYSSLKRQGVVTMVYCDEFLADLTGIEDADADTEDGADVDPTGPTPAPQPAP